MRKWAASRASAPTVNALRFSPFSRASPSKEKATRYTAPFRVAAASRARTASRNQSPLDPPRAPRQ